MTTKVSIFPRPSGTTCAAAPLVHSATAVATIVSSRQALIFSMAILLMRSRCRLATDGDPLAASPLDACPEVGLGAHVGQEVPHLPGVDPQRVVCGEAAPDRKLGVKVPEIVEVPLLVGVVEHKVEGAGELLDQVVGVG